MREPTTTGPAGEGSASTAEETNAAPRHLTSDPDPSTPGGLGSWLVGVGFFCAGVGFAIGGTALALTLAVLLPERPDGVVSTLIRAGSLLGSLGLVVGLVGVWIRHGDDAPLVKGGVAMGVASIAGYVGLLAVVRNDVTPGVDLGGFTMGVVFGLPTGLLLVGVGLREAVPVVAWVPLLAALPLVVFGVVVGLLGFVVVGAPVVAVGVVSIWLGLVTGLPLGLCALREATAVSSPRLD